ncbi:hypothetical protein LTR96_011781 [Exophiala xenobiotica]|nr:hypothetical protein LTR96_011781 [Exophiala xenobiotica]KAK5281322.1 hypothetical protein LTR14_012160 [Exophiala xenobiotica]KAK5357620.1 hypothetical protein LTS03_011516 [Exophiala xenobiotica]KAK5452512.1 hypothetical protein LTR55_012184 [Exophiala xenobiotica]KAK5550572.1 hypothetical protein LTR46_011426 [Exophiala xenobiotica]
MESTGGWMKDLKPFEIHYAIRSARGINTRVSRNIDDVLKFVRRDSTSSTVSFRLRLEHTLTRNHSIAVEIVVRPVFALTDAYIYDVVDAVATEDGTGS